MLRLFRHYVPVAAVGALAIDVGAVITAIFIVGVMDAASPAHPGWASVLVLGAVSAFALYVAEMYRVDVRPTLKETAARVGLALGGAAILLAALGFAIPALSVGRLALIEILVLLGVALVGWRIAWNTITAVDRAHERVLVLGVSRAAETIMRLQYSAARPYTVLGFLDGAPDAHDRLPATATLLGKPNDLLSLVDELQPDVVLVALPDMRGALPTPDLMDCRLRGIHVEEWATFYERRAGKILITDVRPSWLIFADGFVKNQRTLLLKRAVDLALAVSLLVAALPVMAVVALLVKLDSRGPVLFRQARVGLGGRIFTLLKFRSMRADAEQTSGPVWATVGDPRVTRVGRVLRALRLDELPQLFNVIAGDMSFVGPRPERPEFVSSLQRQIPFYLGRLAVKPGITGWAQVRHRYGASVEDAREKLQYDLYYIKNLSPFLDLVIILATVQVVLYARGAR